MGFFEYILGMPDDLDVIERPAPPRRNKVVETAWCNSCWRHFEKRNADGELLAEATVSKSTGEMHVTKSRLGGLWVSEYIAECDVDDIPTAVAVELS